MTNLQFFSLKHFVRGSVSIWEKSYPLRLCWQTLVKMQMTFFKYCKERRQISSFQNFLFILKISDDCWDRTHYILNSGLVC
jgi:hypothetical protein